MTAHEKYFDDAYELGRAAGRSEVRVGIMRKMHEAIAQGKRIDAESILEFIDEMENEHGEPKS